MNSEIKTKDRPGATEDSAIVSSSAERRSFLGVIIGLITSGIAATLGLAIGRFIIVPAFTASNSEQWIGAGPLADIPEGKPVKRILAIAQEVGWGRFTAAGSVWVIRNGDSITVFSAVCPHLGCSINTSANGFICPCHRSSWNGAGAKTGGPTPRDMDTLEHRIEDGALLVKYQSFKQGMAKKEAI
ncbi:MAG: Rieske 2Fe-2S domain-containing protein [Blastocatellia bacterium]|nr:Rieske 2Fe-2S domain-containing protein [Blastocatellia bacterium]